MQNANIKMQKANVKQPRKGNAGYRNQRVKNRPDGMNCIFKRIPGFQLYKMVA